MQLTELLSRVRAARDDVHAQRTGKVDPALLLAARGVLLQSMERYAAELVRRGLPLPPMLRDDLRLQKAIRDGKSGPSRALRR
ncbi:hypothetical protein [Terrabacter terrigena]|uniref:Uncharacterized protein n=1 Tax=Terrabacter terrigena TaxID=574718 RepID=A0ABW3MVN0_9MICO